MHKPKALMWLIRAAYTMFNRIIIQLSPDDSQRLLEILDASQTKPVCRNEMGNRIQWWGAVAFLMAIVIGILLFIRYQPFI